MADIPRFFLSVALTLLTAGISIAQSKAVYRWTDSAGAVHITNRIDNVPTRFLDTAIRMKVLSVKSDGKDKIESKAIVAGEKNINFDKSKDNIILLSIFNDLVKRESIIDTGSEMVVITTKLARALGYNIDKSEQETFSVFGESVTAPVIVIDRLTVGSATVTGIRSAVIDYNGRGETSAIIGMNFLSRFIFEIDRAKGLIAFFPADPGG